MEFKLEFDQEKPTLNFIRLLDDPFYDVLVLIGDIKLTNNDDGLVDENSLIADFAYRIQENGTQVDELLIPDLTTAVSTILCSLLNTDMVEK